MKTMILRALVVWIVIIVVETIHGIVRQKFITPALGDLLARQIGVFVGSVLILAITWLFVDWLHAYSFKSKIAIGLLWCALTFAFEVLLGLSLGFSVQRIIADYDLAQGGFMLFGMIILAFSLLIVSKFRGD
ncbi:MAG: hypothetical protein WBD16_14125 [Pyrinomonadaceae bacterium]